MCAPGEEGGFCAVAHRSPPDQASITALPFPSSRLEIKVFLLEQKTFSIVS